MIIWIIGNIKAGKTTLAKKMIGKNTILLDGDEMRNTINKDLGFSTEDRRENNLRIARLAKLLESQGFIIIVSTICPYEALRKEIKIMTDCKFIYVTGGLVGEKYPFEIPTEAILTVKGNEIND